MFFCSFWWHGTQLMLILQSWVISCAGLQQIHQLDYPTSRPCTLLIPSQPSMGSKCSAPFLPCVEIYNYFHFFHMGVKMNPAVTVNSRKVKIWLPEMDKVLKWAATGNSQLLTRWLKSEWIVSHKSHGTGLTVENNIWYCRQTIKLENS